MIDDRLNASGAPLDPLTYGKPICSIRRDGPPLVDFNGRPVSRPEDLAELGANCQPLNIFGDGLTGRTAEQIAQQKAALDYAFVDSVSSGTNSLQTLSLQHQRHAVAGLGRGPAVQRLRPRGPRRMRSRTPAPHASGDNIYERADLSRAWADSFGGKTRSPGGLYRTGHAASSADWTASTCGR